MWLLSLKSSRLLLVLLPSFSYSPSFCSTVHQYDHQSAPGCNAYAVVPHSGGATDGERASSGTPSTSVHSSPGHHQGNVPELYSG